MQYSQLFATALDFPVSLHAVCPPNAGSVRVESRLVCRRWVARQVRDCLQGPNWKHANLTDNTSLPLATVPRRVGRYRYLLHLTPSTSEDSFDLSPIVCMRRMESNSRKLISPPDIRRRDDCNSRIVWGAVPQTLIAPVTCGLAQISLGCRRHRVDSRWRMELCFKSHQMVTCYQIPSEEPPPRAPSSGLVDSLSESVHESGVVRPTSDVQTPER